MNVDYRVGNSGGVTIIEFDADEQPDARGRRSSDRLMGLAQTTGCAVTIVDALKEWSLRR